MSVCVLVCVVVIVDLEQQLVLNFLMNFIIKYHMCTSNIHLLTKGQVFLFSKYVMDG